MEKNYQQLTSLNFSECEEGISFGYHGNKCMDNLRGGGEGKAKGREYFPLEKSNAICE